MAKHPIIRDRFRTFLAHRSVFTLVLIYIFITVSFSLVVTALWTITTSSTLPLADELGWKLWYSFLFLYGYQPDIPANISIGSHVVAVPLAIASIMLPTLLLGTVVFKLLLPNKRVIIFRDNLSLCKKDGKYFLHVHFYIASKLRFTNVEVKAYARTMAKRLRQDFGLRTYHLVTDYAFVSLPYSLVPTRVNIPVSVNSENVGVDGNHEQMVFTYTDRLRLHCVEDMKLDETNGDECALNIMVTGEIPQLGTSFVEFHRYIVPQQINFEEQFDIETDFDLKHELPYTAQSSWDRF